MDRLAHDSGGPRPAHSAGCWLNNTVLLLSQIAPTTIYDTCCRRVRMLDCMGRIHDVHHRGASDFHYIGNEQAMTATTRLPRT